MVEVVKVVHKTKFLAVIRGEMRREESLNKSLVKIRFKGKKITTCARGLTYSYHRIKRMCNCKCCGYRYQPPIVLNPKYIPSVLKYISNTMRTQLCW